MIKAKLTVIISVFLFCINLALFYFFLVPLCHKYRNEKNLVAESAIKLQTMKEKEKKVNEYQEEIKNMDIEINEIDKKTVPSRDIPGAFMELYNIILSNSLETKTITFGKSVEIDKYSYYNVSFDIIGDVVNIDNFIKDIENNDRIISIDSINFIAEPNNNMKTSFVLKYYMFRDNQNPENNYNYDFMEGKYGTYETWYDMFRSFEG